MHVTGIYYRAGKHFPCSIQVSKKTKYSKCCNLHHRHNQWRNWLKKIVPPKPLAPKVRPSFLKSRTSEMALYFLTPRVMSQATAYVSSTAYNAVKSTSYNVASTPYIVKSIAYNARSTACNVESISYNDKSTTYNAKSTE